MSEEVNSKADVDGVSSMNGNEAPHESPTLTEGTPKEGSASPSDLQDETPSRTDVTASETNEKRGFKRKASSALEDDEFKGFSDQEFKGFGEGDYSHNSTLEYSRVLDRMEVELSDALKGFTPTKCVSATPTAGRTAKRLKQDTDGSRPSSSLSIRSESDAAATSDSSGRGRRPSELGSPLLRVPLERGWRRELVYRAALDSHSRRNADIYYYTPKGKKMRSTREIAENLSGTGLTLENFSFFKEPLGIDDPEKEIIRDARPMNRHESPVASPITTTPFVEGKRVPKPKAPKGASPDIPSIKSPLSKIKVKSLGSRINAVSTPPLKAAKKRPANSPQLDNNNSANFKKNSEMSRRGRPANGQLSPGVKKRGRPRNDDTDYFTPFYNKSQEREYNVVVQIFQYLGMRDLAHCAQVSRLWRQLSATPSLWRHVRMKNSQVSDWGGLCGALKRNGTKRLDLRKMLLPQNDADFWNQFAAHIPTVDTLERIELCRCPARAVEAVCRGGAQLCALRSLCALAVRDARLDPAPLAALHRLQELRLKSMAGLTLASDLSPLAELRRLHHLSLTSIKELGSYAIEGVGSLSQLVSLELGECKFGAEFGAVLARLQRLQRLRLERGTAQCAAPQLLRALATLPHLTQLELVNFDVKVGFDDALAECRNVQRLLIIPTYVSQSATTNKQVLSGVLRLKETLTHLMWGVTIELLRVTELFIDQCEQGGEKKKVDIGECIPVLKPVPGCRLPEEHHHVAGPPQVEILPLPTLQRLLSAQLPHTKLKLLRIPFHATWRQSLADFQ